MLQSSRWQSPFVRCPSARDCSWLAALGAIAFAHVLPLGAQASAGELRLHVQDPAGQAIAARVDLLSEANTFRQSYQASASGDVDVQTLPFGTYQLTVTQSGFAPVTNFVTIFSTLPVRRTIALTVAPVKESVQVNAAATLLDMTRPGYTSEIGKQFIQDRVTSIPGRTVQDLVITQPGWLYEGNAVLHPRGSEYQTQFVVDGIPLTDNRSPGFGTEIEADDVDSMSIYTAGIPAEYGRKMGGVIELNTEQNPAAGWHGEATLYGGSYDTGSAFARAQYTAGRNTIGGSASGSMTSHFLNPVVPQNFYNTGTTGDFSLRYQFAATPSDRLNFSVRHELAHYDIPNEQVQQAAGQEQTASNVETIGIGSWEHIFSPQTLLDVRGMVRDNSIGFNSNPQSTPIEIFQSNFFREGYFRATVTASRGAHEFKFGVESDNTFLNENTSYHITDPCQFATGDTCPPYVGPPIDFAFQGNRPDLEQSAFVQDLMRFHNWTLMAGLRYDHYQLLLNTWQLQPRLSVSRYFQRAGVLVHFSYDRAFQTPSFENILLSSSTQVESLDPDTFLRLPVKPSVGDFYEAGVSRVFFDRLRFDANYYRRFAEDYADDNQLQNTPISFPIAFRKAIIYGVEGKLAVPHWGRFAGFLSYSYMVGNAWNPVTGGLFLGDDATQAEESLTGHFPDSQDRRNTVRGRVQFFVTPRFWLAMGTEYDTGLPFEFDGDPQTVLEQYGQQVLDRINFDRGRIDPSFLLSASAGADLWKTERYTVHAQADGENLTNVLDVLDFGGLFSGNAIGPGRSGYVRLSVTF